MCASSLPADIARPRLLVRFQVLYARDDARC